MVKVVYEPTESGEDEYTRAHGKLWKRGEAVTLNDKDDEALIKKLRGNPQFSVGNDRKEASEEAKERAKEDEIIRKEIDGRSKEAREAKARVAEATADAEAKERALRQVEEVDAAKASTDR